MALHLGIGDRRAGLCSGLRHLEAEALGGPAAHGRSVGRSVSQSGKGYLGQGPRLGQNQHLGHVFLPPYPCSELTVLGGGPRPLRPPSSAHVTQEAPLHTELHPHAPLHVLHPEGSLRLHQGPDPLQQQPVRRLLRVLGVPSTFTVVWTITKIYFEDYGCWDTISTSRLWWILKAPVLTSILVNFILFIRIIRILVQKLQTPNVRKSDKSPYSVTKSHVALAHLYPMAWLSPQVSSAPAPPVQAHESHVCFSCSHLPWQVIGPRRLAKSTLLLIPLFGIHYTVFAFFPDNFNAEVKMIFDLVMGSFQGFLVAVLYCFLNGEVQAELRRKWRRWDLQGVLGLGPKYQHPPGGSSSNGVTCSTQVSLLTRVSPGARRSSSFQAEDSLV
ncbi:vasoactive intestinal polypeptide receptor 1 isoform X3 [Myotis myotis]|uniref:vasoactive intestinal polypeptide receptor 1 isoform X3 n=1 Tax=Myotis myotis TaxID=51298 RepID=UPI00174D0A84|nr:vasoactive intestinal polypeptide receptor 1 isoform X3 [Myotis myotis]